jgi:hypothetical protein
MQTLTLDLLRYQSDLRFRQDGERRYIWDNLRQKYLVVQPEELVRQLLMQYLIQEKRFPPTRIALEKTLIINDLRKRFDALVYNDKFEPCLLIECKAASVNINQSTFEQIAIYNSALRVPFLLLSNGIASYFLRWCDTEKKFEYLNEIPYYNVLIS